MKWGLVPAVACARRRLCPPSVVPSLTASAAAHACSTLHVRSIPTLCQDARVRALPGIIHESIRKLEDENREALSRIKELEAALIKR